MSLEQKIIRAWYQDQTWVRVLTPLSKLYQIGLNSRRKKALSKNCSLPVPVVVVGNITVGGTGKTPLIIHLCQKLSEAGVSVGVVSRGYGAQRSQYPYMVAVSDNAEQVGDEPLMICRQSGAAVVIDSDRYAAAQHLVEVRKVDVILSDDGMQHFALPRNLEILVVDGTRELGNERLIPAGPLREPVERLQSVDFCLLNGTVSGASDSARDDIKSDALKQAANGRFKLVADSWVHVATNKRVGLDEFKPAGNLKAVAGIGNPQRFFNTLKELGIEARPYPLDDHQAITPELLAAWVAENNTGDSDEINHSNTQILMTMKDAVKCRQFASENCWALDVGLEIDSLLEHKMLNSIQALIKTSDENR